MDLEDVITQILLDQIKERAQNQLENAMSEIAPDIPVAVHVSVTTSDQKFRI